MTDFERFISAEANKAKDSWVKTDNSVLFLPEKKSIELPKRRIILMNQITADEYLCIRTEMHINGGVNR